MEFCSDMFLLPLGVMPIDVIDLEADTYLRDPLPNPPPRSFISNIVPKSSDVSYHDFLNQDYVSSSDNELNNNVPIPPLRLKNLEPIFETQESEEFL